MYFSNNIKVLRNRRNMTQEEVSTALNIKRSTLGGYENEVAQPSLEMVMAFATYYNISIDDLLRVDLSKLPDDQLEKVEQNLDQFIKGTKMRVLTSTVDKENNENVELVPLKAVAGYTNGYSDPEFISSLPSFQIPFLSRDRKYRAFQIKGDSMLPIKSGSYIIAEFVQNWYEVKDGEAHIILTRDEGVVFKIIYPAIKSKRKLLLKSLNAEYAPYEINITDVVELWKFTNYISAELPEADISQDDLRNTVYQLGKDVMEIKKAIKSR